MKIIDTYSELLTSYEGTAFSLDRWKSYMDRSLPGAAPLFLADLEECLGTGNVTWEKDYLPVLNDVALHGDFREKAHASFCRAVEHLENRVAERFGKSLDVELIFLLGLCSGAGWVTEYGGKNVIFFGIEKMIELNWCGLDGMIGLIYHELGHVYQAQYGVLGRAFQKGEDSFLWQLFTEGIAMVFEQELVGDPDYFHQDKDGWKDWCDRHFEGIKVDFTRDLPTMTRADQRYFGDWVSYRGRGDVGYYLGSRFVRYILAKYPFDEIISFDIDTVRELYRQFVNRSL
ncbi:MAG: hypothetical protein J1E06_01010 [Acutalibacter sp.]|nr:hypothetical protein [Acutalibacter sp.]